MCSEYMAICELCERKGVQLTEHHLTPRENGGTKLPTSLLCTTCHKQIHALYTNKELALKLNTLAKLRSDEKIIRYLKWVQKQPSTIEFTIKKSKHVRKKSK